MTKQVKSPWALAELRAWVAVLKDEIERRRTLGPEEPALTRAERRMLLALYDDLGGGD